MAEILLLLLIWALADECRAGCALACLLKSGEHSSAWLLPGFCQAFARLFPSLFEEGRARPHCTAHTSHGSSSSLSEGMRAHEPNECFVNTPPWKAFSWNAGKAHSPQSQTPGSWSLTWLSLGWWYHFHRVWFAHAPTKRRNSNNPRWACSGLLFLSWLLVSVTPGSCWCKTFPSQMPLVLEMAGNSFFNFKNNQPTNKNLPQRNFSKA